MTEREALKQIAGFTLSQFMGPHDMALACVDIAHKALAQPEQEPVRIMGFNCVCGRRMEVSAEQGVTPATRQKPVAWGVFDGLNLHDTFFTEEEAQEMVTLKGDGSNVKPLYTTPPQRKPLTDDLYNELLFAVGNKYPNETRHQTALRYILQAEKGDKKAVHGIKE